MSQHYIILHCIVKPYMLTSMLHFVGQNWHENEYSVSNEHGQLMDTYLVIINMCNNMCIQHGKCLESEQMLLVLKLDRNGSSPMKVDQRAVLWRLERKRQLYLWVFSVS